MNDIIGQVNKDLAGIFGLCWHEFDNGEWLSAAFPYDEEHCVLCGASNLHAPRPDFRDIIQVACLECGVKPGIADNCVCDACSGIGSRYVSRLQVLAEKNDTWKDFLWDLVWLSVTNVLPVPGGKDLKYEMRPLIVVTDINQLLVKYRDWRHKHETKKA